MSDAYNKLASTKMILIARAMKLIHARQCDIITHLKDDEAYMELRIPHDADNSPESIVEAIDGMGDEELNQLDSDLTEAESMA